LISAISSGLSGLMVHSAMVSSAAGNLANLNSTNDFVATAASGPALEGSNVDPAQEMVYLLLGEQGFKAAIKVLQTTGEMLGSVLDLRA